MKKLLLILLCLPIIGFGQASDTSSPVCFIPNCFSPNSSSVNDVFRPICKWDSVKQFRMKIYSRRGEEIFDSEDINFGWDGTYNSTTETNEVDFLTHNINKIGGIYIYTINVVDVFNKTFIYTGEIILIN